MSLAEISCLINESGDLLERVQGLISRAGGKLYEIEKATWKLQSDLFPENGLTAFMEVTADGGVMRQRVRRTLESVMALSKQAEEVITRLFTKMEEDKVIHNVEELRRRSMLNTLQHLPYSISGKQVPMNSSATARYFWPPTMHVDALITQFDLRDV